MFVNQITRRYGLYYINMYVNIQQHPFKGIQKNQQWCFNLICFLLIEVIILALKMNKYKNKPEKRIKQ